MKRVLPALLLGLALMTVALPADAWHSDLPIVHRVSVPEQGAWSLTLELMEPGDFAIELEGNTSEDTTRAALGAATLAKDGTPRNSAHLILLSSSDRVVVAKEVDDGLPALGGGISFQHVGDSNLENGFWGVAASEEDQDPGIFRYGFWMGGMETVNLTIRSDAEVRFALAEGTPHMLGGPDFTNGEVNAQAQASAPEPEDTETPTPGAKVLRDASVQVETQHRLLGTWIALGPEGTCQALVDGTCLPAHGLVDQAAGTAEELCYQRTGLPCDGPRQALEAEQETEISWQGPGGLGQEGALWYDLRGTPSGTYTFTIDQVTDAYTGPLAYDAGTGTLVSLQPIYLLLVLADLPPPPALP